MGAAKIIKFLPFSDDSARSQFRGLTRIIDDRCISKDIPSGLDYALIELDTYDKSNTYGYVGVIFEADIKHGTDLTIMGHRDAEKPGLVICSKCSVVSLLDGHLTYRIENET
jgi:hypothetical protein